MPKHVVRPVRALAATVALVLIVVVVVVSHARQSSARPSRVAVATTTPTTVAPATTTAPPTTVATTTTAPPPPPDNSPPPAVATALPWQVPHGKGMWIWQPERAEEGDAPSIVARALANGITHLYVRTGSSVDGIEDGEFLTRLLPVAHAAGLRVIGWDFPYFDDVNVDVDRALEAIRYVTVTGDRLDGFSADIETPAEHVALSPETAAAYGAAIRDGAGPNYPLIATVPRPSPTRLRDYPYTEVVAAFDAIAPMVYWIDQPPDEEAASAVDILSVFGKPVLPVGQAYDGSLEGGPPGTPTPDEIDSFAVAAAEHGAAGISFWSWQHATDDMWTGIAAAPEVGEKPSG